MGLRIALAIGRRAAVVGLALLVPLAAAAQEKVAGTIVTITPPPGYEAATGFAGFVNEETGGSIVVTELPAEAHLQISAIFGDLEKAKTGFASRGVAVERLERLSTADGTEIPVVVGAQSSNGVTFVKWAALFGGSRTVLVTAQSPEEIGLEDEAVFDALRSVSLGEAASLEEKLTSLPFSIGASAPFRVVDTMGGSSVILTASENDVDPTGLSPTIIAAYQLSAPLQQGQIGQVAETLLRGTLGYETAKIESRETVAFAGGDGVLLTGTTGAPGGEDLRFMQYLAVGPEERFIRLIAQATPDDFTRLEEAIGKIVDSVSFK